jgi:hypothetical protein
MVMVLKCSDVTDGTLLVFLLLFNSVILNGNIFNFKISGCYEIYTVSLGGLRNFLFRRSQIIKNDMYPRFTHFSKNLN